MRTIIDIPEEQLKPLDQICREEGISRAECVRRGIEMLLKASTQKRKKVTLEDAFGIFKHDSPFGDGLEYQLKIRAEWDERDRMVDEWAEHRKTHPIEIPKIRKRRKRPS